MLYTTRAYEFVPGKRGSIDCGLIAVEAPIDMLFVDYAFEVFLCRVKAKNADKGIPTASRQFMSD